MLHSRLRELAECAVNETLEYWLKGLSDGDNGSWPELCVELPYLEHGEVTEPLSLTYCVDSAHDTRIELNRTTLGTVLSRFFANPDPPARLRPSKGRGGRSA